MIWTVIEACVGVISACLPTLGLLFRDQDRAKPASGAGSSRRPLRSGRGADPYRTLTSDSVGYRDSYVAARPWGPLARPDAVHPGRRWSEEALPMMCKPPRSAGAETV